MSSEPISCERSKAIVDYMLSEECSCCREEQCYRCAKVKQMLDQPNSDFDVT